ncbi:putative bifunctional diguanylate cyclase/phosphodiesterase [Paenibacillus sp. GCM10023248]|uniref:putative bifunctional diguanylate cyclase/phosphodiesterase n=1 Tax=unclassified Paenibacillus TaxID=185978 RepID=UPI002379DD85|nr:EAL domain-containing protein [Paenibacillus sp. MAHUQ-63]MDD9270582.1 EAL domain-containing protein [Paenibacillus sp. MAHUQ-63]
MDLLISENRGQCNGTALRMLLLNFTIVTMGLSFSYTRLGLSTPHFLYMMTANIIMVTAYVWLYCYRKDAGWIGYIPIFGQFLNTLLLISFIPTFMNALSSLYIVILAAIFMRKSVMMIAICLAVLANVYFIAVTYTSRVAPTPQMLISLLTWSLLIVISMLLLTRNNRELMARFYTLQKETVDKAEQIKHLATTDPLTHLPNRVSAYEHLDNAIQKAAAWNSRVCVLWVNVDNFQMINDSVGYATGDQYLRSFARKMVHTFSPDMHISRSGGDEFNLIVEIGSDDESFTNTVHEIWEACHSPFHVAGVSYPLRVSMGVALYPDHAQTAEQLLICADVAMRKAKAEGKHQFRIFDETMRLDLLQKRKLEDALQDALAQNQFTLHFQKQVHVPSGNVKGYEALLRWQQPEGTYIPPGEWIQLAEETGLIVPIGHWVLRTACRTAKKWQDATRSQFSISVNISALQLMQHDFADQVLAVLAETGLDPRHLVLELTETLLIQSIETSTTHLNYLRNQGVRIALDDFGKGFSSLSYIKQLPADIIKIDKSFIDHIDDSSVDRVIMESIISLVQRIHMEVIAEGVEKQEQLRILQGIGCEYVQGYYFSKPLPENLAFPVPVHT